MCHSVYAVDKVNSVCWKLTNKTEITLLPGFYRHQINLIHSRMYIRPNVHTCMHACMHALMHTYIHTYIHYIHLCVRACVRACVCTYVHRLQCCKYISVMKKLYEMPPSTLSCVQSVTDFQNRCCKIVESGTFHMVIMTFGEINIPSENATCGVNCEETTG